jgi:uncharacterized protein (DUF983 family)
MFNQSYQQLSFQQQIITLGQSYPCPRCHQGNIDSCDLTETLRCNNCGRNFVPLHGARLLHPANRLGWKIAPIFWWDGCKWHWGGTTASSKQLICVMLAFAAPVALLNLVIDMNLWQNRPEWLNPAMLSVLVALTTLQLLYFTSWDFNSRAKGRSRRLTEDRAK